MRPYATPDAFRTALEARLLYQSQEAGGGLDRLRRGVVFERMLARLARSGDSFWVLKGGMALEIRLGNRARVTRDLDLALRGVAPEGAVGEWIRQALVEALAIDHDGDGFEFRILDDRAIMPKEAGQDVWRFRFDARLAGRTFERVKVDIVPESEPVGGTDRLRLPTLLGFAGIDGVEIDAVDRREHFAEKLHALTRPRRNPNTRVKDLADLVLLIDEGLDADAGLLAATKRVFVGAATHRVPTEIDNPPEAWRERYRQLATDLELSASSFDEAMSLLRAFWSRALAVSPILDKET